MSQGYIKEAAYQFSNLYLPGKCSISYVSPGVIIESKRTLKVPERSLGAYIKETAYQFSNL